MRKNILFSLLLVVAFNAFSFGQTTKIFVFAQKGTDGFVDSARASDSANDLTQIIAKRKGLEAVSTIEKADITLEVVNSNHVVTTTQKATTTTRRGVFGGVEQNTNVQQETLPSLTVILRVRGSDYEKELSITDQRFWKDLARVIVDQTQAWLKINASQIESMKAGKQ
jgi:hypothetical protein